MYFALPPNLEKQSNCGNDLIVLKFGGFGGISLAFVPFGEFGKMLIWLVQGILSSFFGSQFISLEIETGFARALNLQKVFKWNIIFCGVEEISPTKRIF